MKTQKMKRRDFLKIAAITGGALVVGGVAGKEIHDVVGWNFQPARARNYLDSIQPSALPGMLPNILICILRFRLITCERCIGSAISNSNQVISN